LRDTFIRLAKKKYDHSWKWKYYKELKFLYPCVVSSISQDNDNDSDDETESEEDQMDNEIGTNLPIQYNDSSSEKEVIADSEDHDLMFLESLAPFFANIDPMRKLVLRSRIQDMLLNEVVAQKNEESEKKSSVHHFNMMNQKRIMHIKEEMS
jgi:hypothetical protein